LYLIFDIIYFLNHDFFKSFPGETHMSNKEKAMEVLREHIEEQELEYADNYRVACINDSDMMDEFLESEENGCCGAYKAEVIINNETWIIGCNYGH
jgi:hypothetical protein